MIEKETFKQVINYVLIVGLFILAFMVLKPILFAIVYGILLAYIFQPVYRFILSKVNNQSLAAFLVCLGVLTILIAVLILILGSLLSQVINFYISIQQLNFTEIIQSFPNFISNSEISTTLSSAINTSLSNLISSFATTLRDFVLNIPSLILQILVVFLIFFFGLKDGEKAFEYFKSLSPMKKETQGKFFKHFENITKSVLVGQIVVGIIQGAIAGMGYFIFGVPNALLLTLLTMVIGVIPIIGPWLVWIPIDVYLFVSGRTGAGIGLLIYGLFLINWIDAIIRPIIVSRKTEINHAIVLIGMIGGLYVFGLIGLIIGPLILAYVLLVLELYRKQNLTDSTIFKKIKDYSLFK